MVCKKCFAEIDDSAKICFNCGTPCTQEEKLVKESSDISKHLEQILMTGEVQVKNEGSDNDLAEVAAVSLLPKAASLENCCAICKTRLEAGSVYCGECGNRIEGGEESIQLQKEVSHPALFCPFCGHKLEEDSDFCSSCGKKPDRSTAADMMLLSQSQQKKKRHIRHVAVLAASIIAGAFFFWPGRGEVSNHNLIYNKDNGIYQVDLDSKKKEPKEYTDELLEYEWRDRGNGGVIESGNYDDNLKTPHFTKDGKYFIYPEKIDENGTFTLMSKDVKMEEAVKLDSLVLSFSLMDDGRIIYLKENKGLYIYEKNKKRKLASNVNGYQISKDDRGILYMLHDREEIDLYYLLLDGKSEKRRLEGGISILYQISEDLKTILFQKDDSIYVIKNLGDKEKLVEDVTNIYVADIEKNTFYYTRQAKQSVKADNFVTDDMAKYDAQIQEPDIADYQHSEALGKRSDYTKTVTDSSYYTAKEAYEKKVFRDGLREELKVTEINTTFEELYYYADGKNKLIEGNLKSVDFHSDGIIVYNSVNESESGPVKLSEVTEAADVGKLLDGFTNWNTSYKMAYQAQVKELNCSKISSPLISEDYNLLYYLGLEQEEDQDTEVYTLYSASYSDKNFGKIKNIDDDVYQIEQVSGSEIYYLKDRKENYGDLYCNGKNVAYDVKSATTVSVPGSSAVVCISEINVSKGYGALTMIKNGEASLIADDVSDFDIINEKSMVMLVSYNPKKQRGDLKYYNGKVTDTIDTDVWSFYSTGRAGSCSSEN